MAKPDFDALLQEETRRGGVALRVDVVLAALPADQRAKVERALRDKAMSTRPLARALSRLGDLTVSSNAVATWRERHGV